MVLSKKANTGGKAGPDTPPWWNRIRVVSEVSLEHNFYVTIKVDIIPGAVTPTELRTGYHKLLSMLKDRNETCHFLPARPFTTNSAILDTDDIPTRMLALMSHFTATLRIKGKTRSVWATARLGFDGDFEMIMNHKD